MKHLKFILLAMLFTLLGMVLAAVIMKYAVPQAMIKTLQSPYDFDKTVYLVKDNINRQKGWSVTAEIDQAKAIRDGSNHDIRRYTIIKFCNAEFSGSMLESADRRHFGVMMPVSVAVFEQNDGRVYISLVNGALISKLFGGEYEHILNHVKLDVEEIFSFMHLRFSVL